MPQHEVELDQSNNLKCYKPSDNTQYFYLIHNDEELVRLTGMPASWWGKLKYPVLVVWGDDGDNSDIYYLYYPEDLDKLKEFLNDVQSL